MNICGICGEKIIKDDGRWAHEQMFVGHEPTFGGTVSVESEPMVGAIQFDEEV